MSADDSNHSEDELKNIQEDVEMDQEPVSLEDLDASDIDDEDGDLILEQKVTVNNEVCMVSKPNHPSLKPRSLPL
jgi:hypothetical protein